MKRSCKGLNIPFEFRRLALLFFYAIVVYILSSLINYENFLLELLKGVVFILLFVILLVFGGCITTNERTKGFKLGLSVLKVYDTKIKI